ncbi:MAG TPA: hypothetical protein VGM82_13230 [Gemmatimonadaceae bacterium]
MRCRPPPFEHDDDLLGWHLLGTSNTARVNEEQAHVTVELMAAASKIQSTVESLAKQRLGASDVVGAVSRVQSV